MFSNAMHPKNAIPLISLSMLGSTTSVRLVQSLNILLSIRSMPVGTTIFLSEEQCINAPEPIAVTAFRQLYACQSIAVVERIYSDFFKRIRQHDLRQTCAFVKHFFGNALDAGRNDYFFKRDAFSERTRTDRRQAFRQLYAFQRAAIPE